MASNPYVNKVQFGNTTVMDISDTDATESDVVSGKTFYKGSGARATGSAVIPDISNCYETTDTAETTIDDADYFPFYDSSASGKRKTLWSNIKAKLKTYFDTLYSLVTISTTGTAAINQVCYQRIGIDSTYTEIKGTKYMEYSNLSIGMDTYTFSHNDITTTSVIDVYSSIFGDPLSSVTVSSGSCTVKFSKSTTRTVRIYIR